MWKRRDSNPRPRRDERSNTILRHLFLFKNKKRGKGQENYINRFQVYFGVEPRS